MEYMEYREKVVSEIAIQYSILKMSLQELKNIKDDKNGAVLHRVSNHYVDASEAIKFFEAIPNILKEELKISELEEELNNFGNTHIKL